MITLTGSRAAGLWFPDFRKSGNKDFDFITDTPDYDLPMPVPDDYRVDIFVDERLGQWDWKPIATGDELYTLKVSHSFWVINNEQNWNKHMADIVFFQRNGCQFIRELYDIVLPIWKDQYRKNPTNLNQNAKNFFGDAVNRKYDHDSVHASIAYGDHPLYEDILKEGSEVAVDNSKFWAMNEETKHKLIREEIYATALERILIPNEYKGSPRAAYAYAARKTVTSLFKGEWALYLVLHWNELSQPDCNYLQRHLDNKEKLIELV